MLKKTRTLPALLLAAMLPLLHAEAFPFAHPLTSGPSKDLNTWLLGVWEHRDEKGKIFRATVTPKSPDRYWVVFQEPGRTAAQSRTTKFEAWISRVGAMSFLSLRCLEGSGPIPPDSYVFAQYSVMEQNVVRLRAPVLEADPGASSFALRREIRRKNKAMMLFADRGTDWHRVSEVYWATGDEPQPFQPLRFPAEPDEEP